ncbi:hypothetical protein [Flavobacterium ajazii]|uniref:hypothetical protein n=1 Tax=Flavobacterium ajazii TaxID=2692318 RepID=UPI0013D45F85|nr:hypothetical protein [Flavobacterium ajazii]
MKLLLYLIIPFLTFNCISKKNSYENRKYIEVFYLKEGLRYPIQLNCNYLHSELMKKNVKYEKIDNQDFIKNFDKKYKALKTSKDQRNIDVRIQIIYHNDKIIDTICMGEHFDIQVNGINKEDSKGFLLMIKQKIYKY